MKYRIAVDGPYYIVQRRMPFKKWDDICIVDRSYDCLRASDKGIIKKRAKLAIRCLNELKYADSLIKGAK